MLNARVASECVVTIPNQIGEGSKVLELLSDKGVNVLGIVGYELGPEQAAMHIASDKTAIVLEAVAAGGYEAESIEVVFIDIPHNPGAVSRILEMLSMNGVSVHHVYATAFASAGSLCVLRTDDNARAVALLAR